MLDVSKPNVLNRFVKMIDQLYDHRVRLIMTAETDVFHLFDKVFAKEKEIESTFASVDKCEIVHF